MAFALWKVQGRFVIPGTRKHGNAAFRVAAASRQQASADLAPALNEQFRRELPEGVSFSRDWAMLNLKWEQFSPKRATEQAPIPEQKES